MTAISEQRNHLAKALEETLQQSWMTFDENLQQITQTVANTLHMKQDTESSLNDDLQSSILQSHLQPGPIQLDWSPKIPPVKTYLPVFLTRSMLRKRLLGQLNQLIDACSKAISQALGQAVEEGIAQIRTDLDKRAGTLEARIIQAIKGKKLARRIDGRWQLSDLDAAELSQQLEELRTIEQRVLALQKEVALAGPIRDAPRVEVSSDSAPATISLNIPTTRLPMTAQMIPGPLGNDQ